MLLPLVFSTQWLVQASFALVSAKHEGTGSFFGGDTDHPHAQPCSASPTQVIPALRSAMPAVSQVRQHLSLPCLGQESTQLFSPPLSVLVLGPTAHQGPHRVPPSLPEEPRQEDITHPLLPRAD